MRGALRPDNTRQPPETRIYHPSGQYNPRPTTMPQENALPPPNTDFTLTGLIPFTLYEFQVRYDHVSLLNLILPNANY